MKFIFYIFLGIILITSSSLNMKLFGQEIDRKKLPAQEFLSVELSAGLNLNFHVSASNYKDDVVLDRNAEVIIKSNQAWILSWSSNGNHYFQTKRGDPNLSVGLLALVVENSQRKIYLQASEIGILNGIATMPMGDDENKRLYVCHNYGAKNQKTLKVSERGEEAHLKHGDRKGVCPGDEEDNSEEDDEAYYDGTEFDDEHYQYDKFCFDNRGESLPCKTYWLSYVFNLKGTMPFPGTYETEIIYTITAK